MTNTRHALLVVLLLVVAPPAMADDEPLPAHALQRLKVRKPLPRQAIRPLVYSPDGKTLAFATHNGAICLKHGDGEPADCFIDAGTINGMAFTADSKTFVAAGASGVRWWQDVKGRGEAKHLTTPYANAVAVSADGQHVATGSDYNRVHIFNLKEGRELHTLTGHKGYVTALSFAPSGKLLATGSHDRTIRIWDVANGKLLKELTGHANQVSALVFFSDGTTLASASWDGTARLWAVEAGKELKIFRGHEHSIMGLSRSADGKILATGSLDGTARVWDVATGKENRRINVNPDGVWSVALTPDGKTLATGDESGQVALWATATGKRQAGGHGGPKEPRRETVTVHCVAYSPDGKQLASGHGDGGVYLWDLATGKERRIGRQHDYVWTVAFSPDGKHVASAGRRDGAVHIWDIATGKRVQTLTGPFGGISRVIYTRDGSQLIAAGGSFDPAIFTFDLKTGKQVQRLEGHTDYIDAIALSPDGRTLASAARDATLRLWDLKAGKELRQIPKNGDVVRVAFSPDGTTLAWGDELGGVYLWDVGVGKVRGSFSVGEVAVQSLGYSRDGRTLLAGSAFHMMIVETASLSKRHAIMSEGFGQVYWAAPSTDGKRLANGDGNGAVGIWDATGLGADARPGTEVTDGELERLWAALAEADAQPAHLAIWRLSMAPSRAVARFRRGLTPGPRPPAQQIARWVGDLDSKKFADRDRAMRELERVGDVAEHALRGALKLDLSLDARRRIEQLLGRLAESPSPDRLRTLRAMEVLENSGAAEARVLLEELAKGAPELLVTREAKAALGRWVTAR